MSDSYRLTRVEELDRDHPGLEAAVREQMKLGRSLQQVAEILLKGFGVTIAVSTLHSYWRRRFNPDYEAEREAYRKAKAQVDVLVSECGADPSKDATQILAMLVKSAIFKQQERLEEADVLKLLAEERKRQEIEQRQQEIEIEKGKLQVALQNAETAAKEAEAKLAAMTDERERVKRAVGAAGRDESSEQKDPSDAIREIREIYNLGDER